jgi:Tol biopolymer transport system component
VTSRAALSWALEQPLAVAAIEKSKPRWVIATTALAVTSVVLGVAYWRAAHPPLQPLIRLDASLGPDAVPGVNAGVAISPDGTRIVFPIRKTDGKPLLATRILDQAAITPLPGTENGNYPFFSPDGEWIGFIADSKLKKVSLRGGAPVILAPATLTVTSGFRGASWGETGISLRVSTFGAPAFGGAPHALTNLGKGDATHVMPQILPGGNAVLFTVSQSDFLDGAHVDVVSLKTGAEKTLLTDGYFGRYLPSYGSTGHLVYFRQGAMYAVFFDPVRMEVRGSPERILEDFRGVAASRCV